MVVPNSKSLITSSEIITVAKDKKAVVSKESILNLSTTKENKYKIIVTAKDGFTTSEYILKITREKGRFYSLMPKMMLREKMLRAS